MKERPNHDPGITPDHLAASLERLDIRELEQRMEFAPLLVDQGLATGTQDLDMPCCVCKIGDPTQLDENGMLPNLNLGMGSENW